MSENIDNERGKTFTAQKPMTDPTAAAAKLLLCPFCGNPDEPPNRHALIPHEEKDGAAFCCTTCWAEGPFVKPCDEITAGNAWNTRPQPAPPEGEPLIDFKKLARNFWMDHGAHYCDTLALEFERIWKIGLAARPKVEDAGALTFQCGVLAGRMQTRLDACVERNGSVDAAVKSSGVAISYIFAQEIQRTLKAADNALAEREAELAMADMVIAEMVRRGHVSGPVSKEAAQRHAARQQQNASVKSDGGM